MSLWVPRPPSSSLLHASRHGLAPNKIGLHPRLISTFFHSSGATYSLLRPPLFHDSRSALVGHYSLSRFASSDSSKATSAHSTQATSIADGSQTPTSPKPTPPTLKEEPKEPLGTRVWKKVKHEAQHYWHGSKLLAKEVRISARLQWKLLHGEILTRRERRQVRLCVYSEVHAECTGLTKSKLWTRVTAVEAHNAGPSPSHSLRRLHHRAFHGIPSAGRSQALP